MNYLVSGLDRTQLTNARELAQQDLESVLALPEREDIRRGSFAADCGADVFYGFGPEDEDTCSFFVHGWHDYGNRMNTGMQIVMGYLTANRVFEGLLDSTLVTPSLIGHQVIAKKDGSPLSREMYVTRLPRTRIWETKALSPEDFVSHLGRDVARLMYCGINVAGWHVVPSFEDGSFSTGVKFLNERSSPRYFQWIVNESENREAKRQNEKFFLKQVFEEKVMRFAPRSQEHQEIVLPHLWELYYPSFLQEAAALTGKEKESLHVIDAPTPRLLKIQEFTLNRLIKDNIFIYSRMNTQSVES